MTLQPGGTAQADEDSVVRRDGRQVRPPRLVRGVAGLPPGRTLNPKP